MSDVTKIEWTFHTSTAEGAGTDSRVTILMFRDVTVLANVNAEPGETHRLDRGEDTTLYWEFKDPRGIGTAVSGEVVPYVERFPNGVKGHLRVYFTIHSDDAWRIGLIESRVFSGRKEFEHGTIDSWHWVEDVERFSFAGEDVLSTKPGEGIMTNSLTY